MSTRFNLGDAVFFMPRLMIRRPLAGLWVALWAIAPFVAIPLLVVITSDNFAISGSTEAVNIGEPSVGVIIALVAGLLISSTMAYTAWLRFLVRDEVGGLIPLRLAGDEWRLFVTVLVFMLLYFLLAIAFLIPIGLAAAGLSAFSSPSDSGVGMMGVVLFVPLFLCFYAWIVVRLLPMLALSIQTRRIVGVSVWAVTKGVFWPMLGAIVVAYCLTFVFQFVLMIPMAIIGALSAAAVDADGSLAGMSLISVVATGVAIAVMVVVFSMMMAMILGPTAYAVRRHAGTLPEDMVEQSGGAAVSAEAEN
ncbi:hypothetical protein [Maricaulis sp.]|uniref:hypothetical protein n=1 Tax=Maricaulis sp. TaxID=1486257 RepID=UPI00261D7D00|nr:hypothetical protein [Maricaulis sp.]